MKSMRTMFLTAARNDEAGALYDEALAEDGYVSNYLRIWAGHPSVFRAFQDARAKLAQETTLSTGDVAILNATTAAHAGNSACSIAWGTRLAHIKGDAIADALLRREAAPTLSAREQGLATWSARVVAEPSGTTQEDVQELRDAGLSDAEILDATLFIAFRLAFCTVNDALGARPDRQLADAAPAEVLASVSYGRAADDLPHVGRG